MSAEQLATTPDFDPWSSPPPDSAEETQDTVNRTLGGIPGAFAGTPVALEAALGHWAHDSEPRGDAYYERYAATTAAKRARQMQAATDAFSHDPDHPYLPSYKERQEIRVGAGAMDQSDIRGDTVLSDLDSASGRLDALNHLTQNDAPGNMAFNTDTLTNHDDPNAGVDANPTGRGTTRCGPSAILGGAIMADGPQGLTKIMDGLDGENMTPEQKKELDAQLKPLRDKLADPTQAGKLTVADMHGLQNQMYTVMHDDMDKGSVGPDGNINHPGVSDATTKKFLADSGLSDDFKRDHLDVSAIEEIGIDGKKTRHAVLAMKDGTGNDLGIYDPYAREEMQLVTDKDLVKDYQDVTEKRID